MSRDLASRIALEADHLNKQDQQKHAEESGGKLYLKTIWEDELSTEYNRHWDVHKDRGGAARLSYEADQFEVPYSPSIASYIAGNHLAMRTAFSIDVILSDYHDDFVASPVEICLVFNQVELVPLRLRCSIDQLAVKIDTVLNMYTVGCTRH